jgi:hypothetical protein
MQHPITITDVLIAISENWAWLGRFVDDPENADERTAVINEVLAFLGGDENSISSADHQAILNQDFSYIQEAVQRDKPHLRPFTVVC